MMERRKLLLVAAVVAGLSVAGCSSSGSVTPTSQLRPASTVGSATTVPVGNPGGSIADMCTVVSAADVKAAYGGDVAAGTKNESAGNGCDFQITGTTNAGAVSDPGLTTSVSYNGGWHDFATEKKVMGDGIEEVTGLGTDAWVALGVLHFKVKGNVDIAIASISFGNVDKTVVRKDAEALAKVILAKLGA
jgi:hypothetical protein